MAYASCAVTKTTRNRGRVCAPSAKAIEQRETGVGGMWTSRNTASGAWPAPPRPLPRSSRPLRRPRSPGALRASIAAPGARGARHRPARRAGEVCVCSCPSGASVEASVRARRTVTVTWCGSCSMVSAPGRSAGAAGARARCADQRRCRACRAWSRPSRQRPLLVTRSTSVGRRAAPRRARRAAPATSSRASRRSRPADAGPAPAPASRPPRRRRRWSHAAGRRS